MEPLPAELEGVGVTERLGEPVPLDLAFLDGEGQRVRLRDVFAAGLPVLLTLNYAECPMLCHLQLEGTVSTMRALDLDLGTDYLALTVSIDPSETPEQARALRDAYLALYERAVEPDAWRYLTGDEDAIRALADAVGFGYRWVDSTQEYAHAAVAILCSPDGTVTRYVYGVQPSVETLRLGLIEAGQGKIGSAVDRFLLFCFHYDADEGRYALAAGRLMRTGGLVTLLLMGFGFRLLRKEARAR